VDLNYTSSNLIYTAFSLSGDFAAPYLPDLEKLLELDIQVSLVYGDADYICNWLGGEAISKVANWSGQQAFNNAGYTNLMVDGKAYGETRQYGKLSFTRVWEAGHEVPCMDPFFFLFFYLPLLRFWHANVQILRLSTRCSFADLQ
jgi:carboxypeptidase C (cathepsin A)